MKRTPLAFTIAALLAAGAAVGSSHREAPLITETPKVDATDFYMFRSYEAGRGGFVTFLANYQPLQDPYGGPNYFLMDPDAVYAINIDNNGDALADLTYEFRFTNTFRNLTIPVNGVPVAVPLSNIGPFNEMSSTARNVIESFTLTQAGGPSLPQPARNVTLGGNTFLKPSDNIGNKSIADYATYANTFRYTVDLPNCATDGRVFVGQRKEGFAVNLGEVFDLINTNPVGPPNAEQNDLADKNVTTIALEVPISCLNSRGPIIGAWTTASIGGTQLSRLSAPLINEVIIGLPDKDKFNASQPNGDGQFATYVTNPTLPELIEILFPGVEAPNRFPRDDLVAAFLTGIAGLNKPANVTPSEMMRLNTSIAPKPAGTQETLGVLAGDTAGFPNGRRPGDDVVDIELRVAMGVLLSSADAPSGQLPYTDGVALSAADFLSTFPYLHTPLPGSPSDATPQPVKSKAPSASGRTTMVRFK